MQPNEDQKVSQAVDNARWYVVHTQSGFEAKAKEALEQRIKSLGFEERIFDNDSWLVVRTTQGITGFVGAGTKPTAISEKEVEAIMKFVKQEQPRFKAKFSVGEPVKVTDGPFSDFIGK